MDSVPILVSPNMSFSIFESCLPVLLTDQRLGCWGTSCKPNSFRRDCKTANIFDSIGLNFARNRSCYGVDRILHGNFLNAVHYIDALRWRLQLHSLCLTYQLVESLAFSNQPTAGSKTCRTLLGELPFLQSQARFLSLSHSYWNI